MTIMRQITESFSRWLDRIAAVIVSAVGRMSFARSVRLVEEESGNLSVQPGNRGTTQPVESLQIANGRLVGTVPEGVAAALRGCRAELVLQPARFLFRPLELPARASEFLDGIVRNQIDRLTPWSQADASFGWSKPVPAGPDRIAVTVAATPRAQVLDFMRELTRLGVESITVSTIAPDASGGVAIKVLDEVAKPVLDPVRVRRALAAVLLLAAIAATTSIAAAAVIAANLDAEQQDVARRIAERRAAIRAGGTAAAPTALRKLEARKHQTPSSVIVIEALSQILPDHTYLTELRIEGDKVRVIGVTRDAPSLIRLIEESSHFTRATFFAPTTRQPSDPGERFNIEARIEPVFAVR
jgi:general secretion pathway protein L